MSNAAPLRLNSWQMYTVVGLVQLVLLGIFALDWRVPIVLAGGFVIVTVILDQPVWAVAVMLGSRLVSTTTTAFFTIGGTSIGLFEPVLVLAAGSLALKAIFSGKELWVNWPWKPLFLAHLIWLILGLSWCVKKSDGLKDIIPLIIVLGTATVIMAFVETWDHVKTMIWVWILTCVTIGCITFFGDSLGLTDYASQWKAAENGRETGLGQQPNWFAMNLMFVIHSTAAFALVQRRPRYRWGLMLATFFIFYTMMTSGSRGGAYSVVIGGVIVSLGQPMFRRWFAALGGLGTLVMSGLLFFDVEGMGSGIMRIVNNLDVLFAEDIRGQNWAACVGMFMDSNGLGIGPGGYIDQLAHYSWFIYESVYRYPHGIFWGELAHTGIVGVLMLIAMVLVVTRMAWQTIQDTKGTEAEVLAWSMPASMAGYFAWSFVEFSYEEKPFWEWLALYTALHIVARKAKEGTLPPIPEWSLSFK